MNDSMTDQVDVVIIGGGSAAFAAALHLDDAGARVLVINGGLPLGGTCVNVGCLPSKFLIRAAESMHNASHSTFEEITSAKPKLDYARLIRHKQRVIIEMQDRKYLKLLEDRPNITVRDRSFAKLADHNRVLIDGELIYANAVIVATGSSNKISSINGLRDTPFLTNESLFDLEELPRELIVLGGGYIGLEIAQAYARFGSKVHLVESADRILEAESDELTNVLQEQLIQDGISIYTKAHVETVNFDEGHFCLRVVSGSTSFDLEGTHVVVATGRKPNTEGVGLEHVGVQMDSKGRIVVNNKMETSIKNIYAIGDCTDGSLFVYTAAYEGMVAASNILGKEVVADLSVVPWTVFTDPQVAGVGLSADQAESVGIQTDVSRLPLTELPRAIAALDTRGFIEIVRERGTNKILGGRIVAREGGELVSELALCMKHGISTDQLAETLHPYLTLSEGLRLAAIGFEKDVATLSCCAG